MTCHILVCLWQNHGHVDRRPSGQLKICAKTIFIFSFPLTFDLRVASPVTRVQDNVSVKFEVSIRLYHFGRQKDELQRFIALIQMYRVRHAKV